MTHTRIRMLEQIFKNHEIQLTMNWMNWKKEGVYFGMGMLLMGLAACKNNAPVYYQKHVEFPEGASIEQKVDMASRLVPSPQQLAWQQLEFTAFLHFGLNTYTGKEWGDGTESPAVFNPDSLDAGQWVKSLKEAGFKLVILTAKHHDGFCLWPTQTTRYSVAASPWRDGKGDVVRELREACDRYGMKFGVYLSPWDRNASCYGDSERYNDFFVQQLTELLTNYGEVHEVWFDGACGEGPNGKKQVYDWDRFYKTIQQLQPNAVMAIMGDDVRWVGNERGYGRSTEWSVTAMVPGVYERSEAVNARLGLAPNSEDLGSREVIARASELFWYPSEVDVSIRPGWFYHPEEDAEVKTLDKLVDIYFQSVGYNSVLLLNIPPDRSGRLHEIDVDRLKQLADYLERTFNTDYVVGGEAGWQGEPGESVVLELTPGARINTFLIQEKIANGQRIEKFTLEAEVDGNWICLGEGTTVGYKRLLRFNEMSPTRLRLTVSESRAGFQIERMGAFYAEPLQEQSVGRRLSDVTSLKMVGTETGLAQAVDADRKTVCRLEGLVPLVVDAGEPVRMTGFVYAPASEGDLTGTVYRYRLYSSEDGKQWESCAVDGEFSNIMHNPIPQFVSFKKPVNARYLKLEPLLEINGKQATAVAELGILTE